MCVYVFKKRMCIFYIKCVTTMCFFQDDYIPYPRIEEVKLNFTTLLSLDFHLHTLSSCFAMQVLERGGPYPQVILPEFGGYWIEDPEAPPPTPPPTSTEIKEGEEKEGEQRREDEQLLEDYGYQLEEISEAARAYRKHFLGRVRLLYYEHFIHCSVMK